MILSQYDNTSIYLQDKFLRNKNIPRVTIEWKYYNNRMHQFAIEGIGIFFGFFVQTIIGFGAQLIAIPIHLTLLNLHQSLGIISVYFLIFSMTFFYVNWKDADKKIVWELSLNSLVGLAIGIYILKYGDLGILKKLLGIFILADVFYETRRKVKIDRYKRLGPVFGFIGGIFAGLFGSGGPVFVTYINNKLEKAKNIRATIIIVFGVINIFRFLLLVNTQIINKEVLWESFLVLPFFVLSIFLGHKMLHKINEELFKKLVLTFLILSGLSLIIS